MARNRIVALLLLGLSVAFLSYCPGVPASLFFYLSLLLPALSILGALPAFFALKLTQSLPPAATRGDKAQLAIQITNRTPLFLAFVRVSFYSAEALNASQLATALVPLGHAELVQPLACSHIGRFDAGVRRIAVRDVLGLVELRRRVKQPLPLLVLPRPVPVAFAAAQNRTGEVRSARGQQDDAAQVSDIRAYVPGDRLKLVHWKLSAKMGDLLVKNLERDAGASVRMILDMPASAEGPAQAATQRDTLLETAASLAAHFVAKGAPVMLLAMRDGVSRIPVGSAASLRAACAALADIQPTPKAAWQDILRHDAAQAHRGGTVIFLSTSVTQELAGRAAAMKAAGEDAAVIGIPCAAEPTPEEKRIAEALRAHRVRYHRIAAGADIGAALGVAP